MTKYITRKYTYFTKQCAIVFISQNLTVNLHRKFNYLNELNMIYIHIEILEHILNIILLIYKYYPTSDWDNIRSGTLQLFVYFLI